MERKRQTRTLVLTVVLAVLFFAGLGTLLDLACKAIVRHNGSRLSLAARGGVDTDILVVGNSRAVNLIKGGTQDGRRIFNLGYNGLTRDSVFALARDFFRAGNHARLVVVEVSGLWTAGANCELKPYWSVMPELAASGIQGCPADTGPMRYFPLTAYNSELFLRAAYYTLRRSDQDWADNNSITPRLCAVFYREHDANVRPRFADAATLKRSVAGFEGWVAEHAPGTRIVYVLAPYLSTPATAGDIAADRRFADATLGPRYLDLSQSLGGDCAVFGDVIHLNDTGRARISARLLAYLR